MPIIVPLWINAGDTNADADLLLSAAEAVRNRGEMQNEV